MSVEEEEVVWRWGMDEYTFVYESSYSREGCYTSQGIRLPVEKVLGLNPNVYPNKSSYGFRTNPVYKRQNGFVLNVLQ